MANVVDYPVLTGPGLMPIARVNPWAIMNNVIAATLDADPAMEIKAAPGVGMALYLISASFGNVEPSDCAITLVDSDGEVLYGPVMVRTAGHSMFTKKWKHPLKLTDNKALEVLGNNATNFVIYVEGFAGQSI